MDEPRHVNGPVTREKLIEAAGEIFAEKGLHGTSIRDITQRAGANIASVNYHFHDKFELYALVLRRPDPHTMETLGDGPRLDLAFKVSSRDAAFQADVKLRARGGLGDVPHLRLRLAPKGVGRGGRGMHLQR